MKILSEQIQDREDKLKKVKEIEILEANNGDCNEDQNISPYHTNKGAQPKIEKEMK